MFSTTVTGVSTLRVTPADFGSSQSIIHRLYQEAPRSQTRFSELRHHQKPANFRFVLNSDMIHRVQPVKKVDGKGIVQYFDPPDWLIIVVLGALLFGLFFMLRNRRQKPN